MKTTAKKQLELKTRLQKWHSRRVFLNSCQWVERYKSTTEESLKSASTASNQVTSKKLQKSNRRLDWLRSEKHNFSYELYGNWIKILDSNKIRKGYVKEKEPEGCQKAKGQNLNRKWRGNWKRRGTLRKKPTWKIRTRQKLEEIEDDEQITRVKKPKKK